MIYDEGNRRWVPSGSSQGLSKIHIYQHTLNNTFRVVGRKLHDHEVVDSFADVLPRFYRLITGSLMSDCKLTLETSAVVFLGVYYFCF